MNKYFFVHVIIIYSDSVETINKYIIDNIFIDDDNNSKKLIIDNGIVIFNDNCYDIMYTNILKTNFYLSIVYFLLFCLF